MTGLRWSHPLGKAELLASIFLAFISHYCCRAHRPSEEWDGERNGRGGARLPRSSCLESWLWNIFGAKQH